MVAQDHDSCNVAQGHEQTTDQDVVNTTTNTIVMSYTLPAGSIGPDGGVRISLTGDYLNNSGAGDTFRLEVRFGATQVFNLLSGSLAASANRRAVKLDLRITNQSGTSDQSGGGRYSISSPSVATDGIAALLPALDTAIVIADAAIDTTSAVIIQVRVEHTTAGPRPRSPGRSRSSVSSRRWACLPRVPRARRPKREPLQRLASTRASTRA